MICCVDTVGHSDCINALNCIAMKQVYWENETIPLLRKHDGKDGHWAGMSNLQWFAAFYGYTGHVGDTGNISRNENSNSKHEHCATKTN